MENPDAETTSPKPEILNKGDGLTQEQKEMIDQIMSDNIVTKEEFKEFMDSIRQDLELTSEEIKKAQALYHKAMDDNSTNIVAVAEINKSYAATVPAKVHMETMREVTEKFKDTFKVLAIVVITSMIIFFLSTLLPSLGIGL